MKYLFVLFLLVSTSVFSQKITYNTDKGYVAEGYDVVSYFRNKAVKGKKKFVAIYDGVKFKFFSRKNKETFNKSPKNTFRNMAAIVLMLLVKIIKKFL
ncbi:MAG: hypothetical protein ACWIPJ_01450 [Polaribacter sp.]